MRTNSVRTMRSLAWDNSSFADMTGAKLLGMHETVTSPKSTDLGVRLWPCGDAGVVERSYAGDVGAFAGPGGNLRPRPQLRVGIVWGGPGRCWRETSRGSQGHPIESPRPPSTGCLRIGRLQAGIPGRQAQGRHATSPRPRRYAEPRRSHKSLPSSHRRGAPARPHILHRHAGLVPASPVSKRQAAEWMPERVRHDGSFYSRHSSAGGNP
jgi:hypothetical protein